MRWSAKGGVWIQIWFCMIWEEGGGLERGLILSQNSWTAFKLIFDNTSIVAPGTLSHCQQCCITCKIQIGHHGAKKWQTWSGKGSNSYPRFVGTHIIFFKIIFGFEHSTREKSRRKWKKSGKIKTGRETEIVATYVIASQPPEQGSSVMLTALISTYPPESQSLGLTLVLKPKYTCLYFFLFNSKLSLVSLLVSFSKEIVLSSSHTQNFGSHSKLYKNWGTIE